MNITKKQIVFAKASPQAPQPEAIPYPLKIASAKLSLQKPRKDGNRMNITKKQIVFAKASPQAPQPEAISYLVKDCFGHTIFSKAPQGR